MLALYILGAADAQAQTDQEQYEHEPVYITARIFQARIKKSDFKDLSDQVFRLPTASLTDYEKWVTGLKKAYPGFEIELLQTHPLRVFKSPRPAIIYFGKNTAQHLQFRISAASSPGDGTAPGTSLIPEVEYHFGNARIHRPIAMAIHPIEAEDGMTYFFSSASMSLKPDQYAAFVRPGASPKAFESEAIYFILAISYSAKKPAEPVRSLDEKQSAAVQESAIKKVSPVLPTAVRQAGLSGNVQVRIEIAPDGRVAHANVLNSSLPEANQAVITAVRQWEFPASLFAENKQPVTSLLTFNFAASAPSIAPPAKSSAAPKTAQRLKAARR
jgi:TonB family protein